MSQSPEPLVLPPAECRHVAESRRLILAAAAAVKPGRAAVLGAGPCREIPLAELAERFEHVTLNDIEPETISQAMASVQLPAGLAGRIELDTSDLTGVTQAVLGQIDDTLATAGDPAAAIAAMTTIVEQQPPGLVPLAGPYDMIVASCLLSQLHQPLVDQIGRRFAARFPESNKLPEISPQWKQALFNLARRMEARFVDELTRLLAPRGAIYLSESVQMCHVELRPDGQWQTEGSYRMLRTTNLADYFDHRFKAQARARWHWVVTPPARPGDRGRLFDVQALVLRVWQTSR